MTEHNKEMEDKIKAILEKYGVADQRSDAWHTKRGEMLTASEIWKAFGDSTPMARHELIMSKLVPKKQENGNQPQALIWGTRFESVAKDIYSELEGGIQIVDTTCVQHPEYSFLGASPDGIILTENSNDVRYGRLVEFKCPISRVFDETTPIPNHYWHQMQMQMECTDLYECDYVEMKFKQMYYAEWTNVVAEYKSCFAVNTNTGEVRYRHYRDTTSVNDWKIQQFKEDVFASKDELR